MKAHVLRRQIKSIPAMPPASPLQGTSAPERSIPKPQPLFDDVHARIAVRAYELYMERGYRDGAALEDWLDAEGEVLARTFPV